MHAPLEHASIVHGSLSLHWLLDVQVHPGIGVPGTQLPFEHWSLSVQGLLSLQGAVLLGNWHTLFTQRLSVHGLGSLQSALAKHCAQTSRASLHT